MKALESSDDRFEAFPDPLNNWIVWDRDEDDFAEVGTQILSSLPESRRASVLLVAEQTLI